MRTSTANRLEHPHGDRQVRTMGPTSRSWWRSWAVWSAGFLAFPPAGLIGRAVAGPVDDPVAALLGGTVTGLVIGVGQVLAGRGRLPLRRWPVATSIGMGLGLLGGAAVVDYGTTPADLALMGALTGAVLGAAQALALPRAVPHRWVWAAVVLPLWALGWTVTTLAGVDVEAAYTVFGATGALAFSAVSGLVLLRITDRAPAGGAPMATAADVPR